MNLGIAFVGVCLVAVFVSSRSIATSALLAGVFLVPLQEIVQLGPLHFNSVRLLLLGFSARLFIRGEWRLRNRHVLDALVLTHILVTATAYVLLRLDTAALVNRLGVTYELLLSYLIFRAVIQDVPSLRAMLISLACVTAIIALAMTVEHVTRHPMFSVLGGVSHVDVRVGRARCQGPFQNAIIAGVFAATAIPMFLALRWTRPRAKTCAAIGCVSSLLIVWASGSSTPAMCGVAGIAAIFTWRFRPYLRVFRLTVVVGLFLLHIVMKDPVWALIARGGVFAGSTGYYRYLLIDLFIKNFSEWWMLGTGSYIQWSIAYGSGMWDMCNMFVRQGIDGGLLSLILFTASIVVAFHTVGDLARGRKLPNVPPLLPWAFGAAVFSHCIAFFGLNYFDGQISMTWYMLLAIIAALRSLAVGSKRVENATVAAESVETDEAAGAAAFSGVNL